MAKTKVNASDLPLTSLPKNILAEMGTEAAVAELARRGRDATGNRPTAATPELFAATREELVAQAQATGKGSKAIREAAVAELARRRRNPDGSKIRAAAA